MNNLTTKNSSLKHQIARMEEDQSRLQVIYDAQDMTPADLQVRELRNAHESVGRERRGRVDGFDCFCHKYYFFCCCCAESFLPFVIALVWQLSVVEESAVVSRCLGLG